MKAFELLVLVQMMLHFSCRFYQHEIWRKSIFKLDTFFEFVVDSFKT